MALSGFLMPAKSEIKDFFESFNRGDFPNQRLGQAFCNKFDLRDHELFYGTHESKTFSIIAERYTDVDSSDNVPD